MILGCLFLDDVLQAIPPCGVEIYTYIVLCSFHTFGCLFLACMHKDVNDKQQ